MPSDEMRASNQDREEAVRLFCQAYAVARLDLGDTCDRAAAAYSARTRGDLRRLTADLPPPSALAGPGANARTRPGAGPRRHRRPPRRLVVAVLLTALAWLAMAAADLMPIVTVPLAALPLVLVSMAVLFAAARIAGPGTRKRTREAAVRHPPRKRAVSKSRSASYRPGKSPTGRIRRSPVTRQGSPPSGCRKHWPAFCRSSLFPTV